MIDDWEKLCGDRGWLFEQARSINFSDWYQFRRLYFFM